MKIKDIVQEDFVNYKKPAMFIAFPFCSFKCDKECGKNICQNSSLVKQPNINIDIDKLVDMYLNNPISQAVVCGGLEPFDSWEDLQALIMGLRYHTDDDIVIYTGYTEEELTQQLQWINLYEKNIIVKFGRFKPDMKAHLDPILGVNLASLNQYAKIFGQ